MRKSTAVTIQSHFLAELGVAYLSAGESGPAVVMLHGWGAFKELWWSTLGDLGQDYRCYALDFPGHHASPMGSAASMVRLADLVAAFCEALGLDKIILIGHSMGGAIAAELILQRPELVERLILVDAAIDAQTMPAFARTYLRPGLGWPALRIIQLGTRMFTPMSSRVPHQHGGGWIRPWLRRSYYVANSDIEGLHRLLGSLFSTSAGERLAEIAVPTLVISGQLDSLVPAALSRRLAQRIPGARYVEIPGALHNPMDERPRAFQRILREFMESG